METIKKLIIVHIIISLLHFASHIHFQYSYFAELHENEIWDCLIAEKDEFVKQEGEFWDTE